MFLLNQKIEHLQEAFLFSFFLSLTLIVSFSSVFAASSTLISSNFGSGAASDLAGDALEPISSFGYSSGCSAAYLAFSSAANLSSSAFF